MKKRVLVAVAVAVAAFGARAADETQAYSLGCPTVTPIRDTKVETGNAWLASNAVHVAMSSCSTNAAVSTVDSSRIGATGQYRLDSAEVGFTWERLKPEYYLGDMLDAPPDVDWVATYDRYRDLQAELEGDPLAGGFLFNTDETSPCVYVVEGGTHRFDWVLKNGETNTLIYVLAPVAQGRPRRLYWTDYPYNGQKISLQGKFVRFFGDSALVEPYVTNVTQVIGGQSMDATNVITRGLYLDENSMVLEVRGQLSGQVVMVYYDSGNYDAILGVQVLEICPPDVIVNSGVIGTALKPNGRGYDVKGLTPRVTAETENTADERGDYLYRHVGQHSYSPKNGEVFPIRPTEGQRWKAEVTWMETDAMGVQWPFEIDQYNIVWPEDISRYVRGNLADDLGADIVITNAYTAELQKYQEPDGHACDVDGEGRFRTVGAGKSLLKLTSDDDVWFLPIESVWRNDEKVYSPVASRVNVGSELTLRSGTRAGVAPGARPFFATDELPGYVYQAGTPGKNYDPNLYSETNAASAIYPIAAGGNIEVWWSECFQLDDMPAPVAIPALPQVYRPIWPQPDEAPQIVLASQEGSANETIHAHYGAAYFDTTDARLTLSDRSYFSPSAGGTVMFWTRSDHYAAEPAPASTNAPGRLLTAANGKAGPVVVEVVTNTSGPAVRATVGKTTLEQPLPKNEPPNAWHHVAVAFGGAGGVNLYLDGVRKSSALPEGYTAVEYIESTKDGKQYINTGYVASRNTRIVADFNSMTRSQEWGAFFGVTGNNHPSDGILLRYFNETDNLNGWFCNQNFWDAQSRVGLANTRIIAELKQKKMILNGEEIAIPTKEDGNPCSGSIYIFCANNLGGGRGAYCYQAMRLYSFQIYEGEELKRDFVPCIRTKDKVAGLYDLAKGEFYANAGQGSFNAGTPQQASEEPEPEPEEPAAGGSDTPVDDLPDDYLRVEYIESTPNGGQYIDTGYAVKPNTSIVADFNPLKKAADWEVFFGAIRKDEPTDGLLLRYREYDYINGWFYTSKVGDWGEASIQDCANKRITATLQAGSLTVDDGVTRKSADIKTEKGASYYNGSIYIFGCNNAESGDKPWRPHAMRLYSFKIYEGEELKRDFVPCIRIEDWAAGLYDKANNTFYPNAGKGEFRADWEPDNFIGAADGDHLAAVGREMAEVTFFDSCLTVDEIAGARYASRSGDETGVTGYFSFRRGEDLVSLVQTVEGDVRTFRDRTTGADDCVAVNVAFVEPGAPAKGGVILQSDTTPVIYYQNDPAKPGYNPNDEHAFVREGSGGYVVWALRSDLATADTPPPGVFAEYTAGGRNRLQFFHVVATNEGWKTLSAPWTAGRALPGPKPLTLFDNPWLPEDRWDPVTRDGKPCLAPAYRDRKGQIWARAAGTLDIRMYYAMQEDFYFPSLGANAQPAIGTPIPWLARHADKEADVLTGEPAPWRWDISWPKDVNTMKIGQTLTTAVDGLPEVWNAKSVSVVYPVGFRNGTQGGDVAEAELPVMLSDPTAMQSVKLPADDFKKTGLSTDPNGGLALKGGKYHFTELPPSLSSRLYYDTTNQRLCFVGERVEKNAGATVLYPNVLSEAERTAVLKLVKPDAEGSAAWTKAVNDLAKEPVLPNAMAAKAGSNGEVVTTYAPVDHYALTALGPTNYVVIIENDASASNMTDGAACPVADGDAINMRVFLVTNLYYTGRIVTREDEVNLLSQQLSVLYTEPFGGKPDDYEFQWRHAAPNQDGTIPVSYDNPQIYKARPVNTACGEVAGTTNTYGKGLTRFVVGQQGDTLANMVNTYWICRYRALPDTPAYRVMGDEWSGWCAPPALAEGWVQRVLNNVTPFNQRMTDLYNNKAETAVSMIQQAGGPFTGDVALNQDNLASVGLIQLYETLLNKAESMSLLLHENDAGANKQLLLAVERLGDLYKVLGDEAYSDAKNPTIGFGEKMALMDQVTFASEASSLFCFDNQVNSLLDEELCLLRGRSGVSAPTTRMGPYYNRLLWNFTKGITAGEVAYAVNYNVSGTETVALSEEQAARVYPQGHGDAYGHYLSALKGWYRLLRNPYFSWGRPAQGEMNLADSAVNVDYYEEAKFAEAAADLAKTAADVVDLSARKAWRDNGKDSSGYLDGNITNAFGYGEWASRGGYGALVNWVTANSILPEDITLSTSQPYTDKGLARIDRGTVDELADICENANRIQAALDRLDAGLNPLGLSDRAVPFDISPIGASDGSNTHFEQVRDRAKTALANARKVLDRAQTQASRMRMVAETAENYANTIAEEEADYNRELINVYGTPYSDDIGPGKTYKQGYEGPDVIHYMWMDLAKYGLKSVEDTISKSIVRYKDLGSYRLDMLMRLSAFADGINTTLEALKTEGKVVYERSASGLIVKPAEITGTRRTQGSIQAAYGDFLLQYAAVQRAIGAYDNAVKELQAETDYSLVMFYTYTGKLALLEGIAIYNAVDGVRSRLLQKSLNSLDYYDAIKYELNDSTMKVAPSVVGAGMSVVTSPRSLVEAVKAPIFMASASNRAGIKLMIKNTLVGSSAGVVFAKLWDMLKAGMEYNNEVKGLVNAVKDRAAAVNAAYNTIDEAVAKLNVCVEAYNAEVAKGESLLAKRESARKRQVDQLSQLRYNEMLFRKIRDKSLTRYSAAFDLAQKYVYMAAQVYDYETALKREDEGSGDAFISKIVSTRALGAFDKDGEPMLADDGDLGLSGYLAQMDANWLVLKPRLGINNPQPYATWFSLRKELFRILGGAEGDAAWAKELDKHWTDDILSNAEFQRHCQPFQSQFGIMEKEPGLVIPFETTIDFAKNLFGNDLAGGDHAYDSSWYSTRIAAAGVWFDGYNAKTADAVSSAQAQLAADPVVYLVPVGYDCLRAPGLGDGTYWQFSVLDQVIAAPYDIGSYELDGDTWMPSMNDADWEGGDATVKIRKHPSFRAYFNPTGGEPDDSRLDATRLIGRSVWNTRWLLVIPAGAMNADREKALSVFINGSDTNRDGKLDLKPVSDIKIGFKTYSQSGN